MKAHNQKTIDTIRGKNLVAKANRLDVKALLEHIDALEGFLDDFDTVDTFGTEGWRHAIGLES